VPTKPLEYIASHPALWLTLYGCGTILTTAAVASAAGGAFAGTVAGLLTLAGTVGYESLSRRNDQSRTEGRIATLARHQDRLIRDVARARNEIDTLKDDLERTAQSLHKKTDAEISPKRATINRPRPAPASPKNFNDLHMMAASRLANTNVEPPDAAPKFSGPVIAELLHHAVQNDRIEAFAQPIVRLPSRKLAYIELFARIRARAGIYLSAAEYRQMAEEETLISEIDRLLLLRAIEGLRADARRDAGIGYFLNISARTLKDMGFMNDLLEFARSNLDLTPYLIFELQQKEFETLPDNITAVMKGLSRLGCSFSLDHVGAGGIDSDRLRDLNIKFLKIEAARLARMEPRSVGKLKEGLDHAGITLIVERLEIERDLRELLDFEIDYGEGFLFGKPDLEIAYRSKKAA
jgi:cyclic-di-GMP phosphodiesterase TipF (flagellum assembly factor)